MKIKVWTKIGFFSIIAAYILLFSLNNLRTKTELWLFFGDQWTVQSNVLLLALGAFLFGILTWLLIRAIFRTMAQVREMKRKRAEKEAIAIISRASKLRTRDASTHSDPAFPVVTKEDSAG
jgi:uncharacterized integral membrane protein